MLFHESRVGLKLLAFEKPSRVRNSILLLACPWTPSACSKHRSDVQDAAFTEMPISIRWPLLSERTNGVQQSPSNSMKHIWSVEKQGVSSRTLPPTNIAIIVGSAASLVTCHGHLLLNICMVKAYQTTLSSTCNFHALFLSIYTVKPCINGRRSSTQLWSGNKCGLWVSSHVLPVALQAVDALVRYHKTQFSFSTALYG